MTAIFCLLSVLGGHGAGLLGTLLIVLTCLKTLKKSTQVKLLTLMVQRDDGRESGPGRRRSEQWV